LPLTLEQRRMLRAYESTQNLTAHQAEWKRAAMDLGANVQRCGLLQALAFLKRDAAPVAPGLLALLRDHLVDRSILPDGCDQDLAEAVARIQHVRQYMLATRETLAFSLWLKRSAQALLD